MLNIENPISAKNGFINVFQRIIQSETISILKPMTFAHIIKKAIQSFQTKKRHCFLVFEVKFFKYNFAYATRKYIPINPTIFLK